MLSWEGILKDYVIRYSDQIRKVTLPLRDHFGISFFAYLRVEGNGQISYLTNRPDWLEYYIVGKFFLEDPCLRYPNSYKSGFYFLDTISSKKHKETSLKSDLELFNLDPAIILVENGLNTVELFGFAGDQVSTYKLHHLSLNQHRVLKSYGTYFKKELCLILHRIQAESIFLPSLVGNSFCCASSIHPAAVDPASHQAFLTDLGMGPQLKKAALLSKRERECLKLLLLGKSAKDIASDLRLSSRTVEFYFENIKDKLACGSKQDMFLVAKDFEELGLL